MSLSFDSYNDYKDYCDFCSKSFYRDELVVVNQEHELACEDCRLAYGLLRYRKKA